LAYIRITLANKSSRRLIQTTKRNKTRTEGILPSIPLRKRREESLRQSQSKRRKNPLKAKAKVTMEMMTKTRKWSKKDLVLG
jgi:hypothetical protein